MNGMIAVTDYDWFRHLSSVKNLDEVNFWRPSDIRKPSLREGSPVIFKLRKPFGGWIVGYGVFVRHDVFPAWLAWQNFEEKNGAPSFPEMRRRIERLRSDTPEARKSAGDYLIGCLMLSEPCFFADSEWIRPPAEWPENTVQGKTYDLSVGEGARVWQELLARDPRLRMGESGRDSRKEDAGRFGPPILVHPRRGQGIFRSEVMAAYGRACAVTSEHSLPVLEAAHIRPYADEGVHEVSNGILLRSDIHRLFDKGYVAVDPKHHFIVSNRLREDFENGRTYYPLHGQLIALPGSADHHPDPVHLHWHLQECFKG